MRWDYEKTGSWLYHAGNWVVRIVGSVIFLVLTWYVFRYTYYMDPGWEEVPRIAKDSMARNILAAVAAAGILAALMVLEKRMDKRAQLILRRFTLAAAMFWMGAASFWWITSADRVPEGDQAFVYGGASYFMEGNYDFLANGGYCGMYPHQLGLIALVELIFLAAGAYNYYVIEYICVILAVGIVYLGYRVISEVTDSMAVSVGYNLLMMGCLPLIFYTPWVYGDIPGIFFALSAAWMLLLYSKRKKTGYLAVLVVSIVLAMLVRKHSLILLTAFCIAAALYALKNKDWKIVTAAVLAVVLSQGTYQGIYKMYEVRSGIEHSDGIPIITWVTMGMQESNGAYGWYNDYPKIIYRELGFDRDMAAAVAKRDLVERLHVFKDNPAYAKLFFKEKILSQWNEPLYQSLFFNANYKNGTPPEADSIASKISGVYFVRILAVCDRWHFIVFAGMFLYFLFAVKKDSNILQHVLAITMIGGFFFSIIHEAKARYIFPYYVMMFPFAVYGYQQALRQAMTLVKKNTRNRKIVDIEDYRKSA